MVKVLLELRSQHLYIASVLLDERRSQHHISLVAGVTEDTVRNRYKDLDHLVGEDFSVQ